LIFELGELPGAPWQIYVAEAGEGNPAAATLTERAVNWLTTWGGIADGPSDSLTHMGIGLVITRTRRLAAHEGWWMASLGLWVARRSNGVGDADFAVGYARAQAPTAYGLVFVFVVETVGVSFMLAPYPVAHLVMLLLDLYTVFLVLGLHAAAVTRPHVVGPDGL
jgi:hypothetical protein